MAANPSSPPVDEIQSVLENRPYRAIRFLGRGGVASVWLVQDTNMGREFALKVLHLHHSKDQFFTERFLLEARAMASIDHPNVPWVSNYWEAADGRHCMLMELLDGQTLAQELAKRKRLPAPEVVQYSCQTLKALVAAHAKGLVHRDIKPENLFLHQVPNVGRQVKLLDFGLARVASASSDTARFRPVLATQTGDVVGSPRFASPESLRGKPVDERSDLYSLGVVIYVSLVGLLSNFDMATRPVFSPPSSVGAEGCTPELDAVILRAVEPNPRDRFQTAQEFLDALMPHHPPVQYSRYNLPREALMNLWETNR
jgi:serine/threonine-protein kinase